MSSQASNLGMRLHIDKLEVFIFRDVETLKVTIHIAKIIELCQYIRTIGTLMIASNPGDSNNKDFNPQRHPTRKQVKGDRKIKNYS